MRQGGAPNNGQQERGLAKLRGWIQYLLKHEWSSLLWLGLLIGFLALWWWPPSGVWHLAVVAAWSDLLSPLFGVATLLAAGALWLSGLKDQRVDSYSKRADIEFVLPDRLGSSAQHLLMVCRSAHFSGESDLRPLAQQIGSQMASLAAIGSVSQRINIQFRAPHIHYWNNGVHCVPGSSGTERVVLYHVRLTLLDVPKDWPRDLRCLTWEPPFNGDSSSLKLVRAQNDWLVELGYPQVETV